MVSQSPSSSMEIKITEKQQYDLYSQRIQFLFILTSVKLMKGRHKKKAPR